MSLLNKQKRLLSWKSLDNKNNFILCTKESLLEKDGRRVVREEK